jgi:hypothetical protein
MLDIRRRVVVMGKAFTQCRDFWMRLGIIPTDAFLALEYGVAIVQELTVRKVQVFEHA